MPDLSFLKNGLLVLSVPVILSALLTAWVPRSWRVKTIVIWLLLPLFAYVGAAILELALRSPVNNHPAQTLFYGWAIISPMIVIAWSLPSCVGIGLGLLLGRKLGRHQGPIPASPRVERTEASSLAVPDAATVLGWPLVHVGPLGDRLMIGGLEVGTHDWVNCGPQKLHFAHPNSASALICDLYEAGGREGWVRFAAGEVSNGIWAFFSPTPSYLLASASASAPVGVSALDQARFDPPPSDAVAQCMSPDGSIRVDIQSLEWSNSQWVNTPRVTDIAGDRLLLDLWDSDCHAITTFPADQTVRLAITRASRRQSFVLTLDLGRQQFDLQAGRGLAMASHVGPLDKLNGLVSNIVTWPEGGAASTGSRPSIKWRSGLAILLGAGALIGAISYYNYMHDLGSHIIVTPMSQVPVLKLPP